MMNMEMQATRLDESLRAIDAHAHLWLSGKTFDSARVDRMLALMDRVGIWEVALSLPITEAAADPAQFRAANDLILEAMRYSPRIRGFCFVNPGYVREALAEIDRCVGQSGMLGIKLYHQYRIDDPAMAPVLERCGECGIPVLMHAAYCNSDAVRASQPNLTTAAMLAAAARRYPQTTFIHGHICCGDVYWSLRQMRLAGCENYYCDVCGSNFDLGLVRQVIDAVGARQVLFGSDNAFTEAVCKYAEADLPAAEARLVYRGNFERIVSRRNI